MSSLLERAVETIETLWGILDDIDTAGDIVKGDNEAYRANVEKLQRSRFDKTQISTDGYTLGGIVSELKAALSQQEAVVPSDCADKYIPVSREAVDWLKEKFPALCVKSGMCEQIGGRLYTKTISSTHPQPQKVESKVPRDEEGFARTGNVEADSIINRLLSPDPDFDDCTAAAAYIYKLLSELKGPGEFATWKDAAIAERMKKNPMPQSVEEFIKSKGFEVSHTSGVLITAPDFLDFMAGKALVPVEPTDWILEAIRKYSAARYHPQNEYWRAEHIWKSIIKAAKGE